MFSADSRATICIGASNRASVTEWPQITSEIGDNAACIGDNAAKVIPC